jgi:hypothetical protein
MTKGCLNDAGVAPAMFSVPDFCASHGISRALFYKLHAQGKAPRICKVGARSLICADDAAAWRRGLERQAA